METAQNPADDALRGLYAHNLIEFNAGGMAQIFFGIHLRIRAFLMVQIPQQFLQMILK